MDAQDDDGRAVGYGGRGGHDEDIHHLGTDNEDVVVEKEEEKAVATTVEEDIGTGTGTILTCKSNQIIVSSNALPARARKFARWLARTAPAASGVPVPASSATRHHHGGDGDDADAGRGAGRSNGSISKVSGGSTKLSAVSDFDVGTKDGIGTM